MLFKLTRIAQNVFFFCYWIDFIASGEFARGGGITLLGLSNTWVFLMLLLSAVFLHYLQQTFRWGRLPNGMMVARMLC